MANKDRNSPPIFYSSHRDQDHLGYEDRLKEMPCCVQDAGGMGVCLGVGWGAGLPSQDYKRGVAAVGLVGGGENRKQSSCLLRASYQGT